MHPKNEQTGQPPTGKICNKAGSKTCQTTNENPQNHDMRSSLSEQPISNTAMTNYKNIASQKQTNRTTTKRKPNKTRSKTHQRPNKNPITMTPMFHMLNDQYIMGNTTKTKKQIKK